MDEPRAYYAKWNKTGKEIPWFHLYVERTSWKEQKKKKEEKTPLNLHFKQLGEL